MANPISLEAILKDMKLHHQFYIRGVLNSMLPEYINGSDRVISEKNISGEAIELMRGMVNDLVPNADELPEGFVGTFGYEDINKKYNLSNLMRREGFDVENFEEEVKTSLGTFRVYKEDGKMVIKDTYDFPEIGEWKEYSDLKTFMDYYDAIRKQPRKAKYFGARFVAERIMHDGMDTNLAVNITIPPEPQTVDIDYDDDIDPDAPTFVFEGPMTNKRASLWKTFTNMFVSEAQAAEREVVLPKPKPTEQMEVPMSRRAMQDRQLSMSVDAESA
jgi:hypothetical protein